VHAVSSLQLTTLSPSSSLLLLSNQVS
jgi:hypothetical protein